MSFSTQSAMRNDKDIADTALRNAVIDQDTTMRDATDNAGVSPCLTLDIPTSCSRPIFLIHSTSSLEDSTVNVQRK